MTKPFRVEYRHKDWPAGWVYLCSCFTRERAEARARWWERSCYGTVETRIVEKGEP